MLEINNLHVSVDNEGNTTDILNGVNLSICDNEFIVITGPNGGGKTTLAKSIMGLYPATDGSIIWNGENIETLTITERAKKGISFGFQQPPRFKGLTVSDLLNTAVGRKLKHDETCSLLNMVGLCAKDYLSREVGQGLSGGEIKRIEIATVLAKQGKLMIFDEPEAGIDIWSFSKLTETFRTIKDKRNATVIIISHQERIISLADKVVLIKNGVITDVDTPDKILPKIVGNTVYTCSAIRANNGGAVSE